MKKGLKCFLQWQFPQTSGVHGTGPSGRFSCEPVGVNMTGFHPDVLTAEECEDCRTQSSGSVCAAVFADFAVSSFRPSTFAVSPLTCPGPSLPFSVSFLLQFNLHHNLFQAMFTSTASPSFVHADSVSQSSLSFT